MSIKLDLTEEEVNLVLNGLAELPYRQVCHLIPGISKVARDQLKPPPAPSPVPPAE